MIRPLVAMAVVVTSTLTGAAAPPDAAICVPPLRASAALHSSRCTAPAIPTPTAAASRSEVDAKVQARRTGRPVEVKPLTSPTTQVFARPDGTMQAEVKARPVRVKRGEGWVPIDTTLVRRADGSIAPVASEVDVRFSGGGDGPFATLSHEGQRVALRWPGTLPQPSLAGSSATYQAVLPEVDLVVTATTSGFTEKLVVHTPAAARRLTSVRFGLHTENWSPDRLKAFMWDSSPHPRRHPMRVAVTEDSLTVIPDQLVLADPRLVYPLHLDPDVQTPRTHWTMVNSSLPSQSYYDSAWHALVGIDPAESPTERWRSYFELDTSATAGKHIISATFRATLLFSHSCAAEPVHLWHTGAISSATTWSNAPGKIASVGAPVTTIKAGHEACPGTPVAEFDATSLITRASAESWTKVTVALAADETSGAVGGKLFENDAQFPHKVPGIGIVYNSIPSAPAMVPGTTMPGCAGSPAMWVTTLTPQLAVTVNDADSGDRHGIDFEIRSAGTSEPFHSPPRTVSGTYTYDVPDGVLADGGRYEWRARAADSVDTSPYNVWCPFTVDITGPSAVPVTSSPHFLQYRPGPSQYGIRVDQLGQFTFRSGGDTDVAGYDYEIRVPGRSPVRGRAAAGTPGGTATLSYRPLVGAETSFYEITVWCVDLAGNRGPRNPRYQFRVKNLPAVVDIHFSEGQGSVAADMSPAGPDGTVTFTGGMSWVDGRHDLGAHLDGSAGTVGTTALTVMDTAQSYTVMAWARLEEEGDWFHVLTHGELGLELRYDGFNKYWEFATRAGSKDGPQIIVRSDMIAQLGVWTHLTAVHDRDLGRIILYVNGRKAGEAAHPTPWTAGGPLRLGGIANQHWLKGSLDEVTVFDTALSAAKIRDEMGSLDPFGGEAHWRMDETGGLTAEDHSGNGHSLVRYGASSWLDGRHVGAVGFDGGWAHTDRPVVETNASFSVAAWVRLDRLPGQDQYIAVSQDGRWDSRFRLGVSRGWGMPNGWVFTASNGDVDGDADPSASATVVSDVRESTGVWTHLAGVYDHAAGRLSLYVNGRLSGTAPFTGTQPAVSSLVIGRWQNNAWRVGGWPGAIDDVHAAQRAVTAAELATWMNWQKWGANAHWTFDAGAGELAEDVTGNDHTAVLRYGTTWADGKVGKALRLTGPIADTFEGAMAYTGQPVVRANASFTVAAWGRLDTLGAPAVLLSQEGVNDSGFALVFESGRWVFRMSKQDSATGEEYAAAGGGTPQAGVWTHVAGVYDHAAGNLKLYVNGSLAATTAYRATWFADRAFIIGFEKGGSNGWPRYYWKGEIDDVHVLDHAATAQEIGGLMPLPTRFTNETDHAIPDNTTIDSPIAVSGLAGNASATTQVDVNITHTYIGDLVVSLIAPDGSSYVLHNRTGGSDDNIVRTYTVNVSSEAANGTWKLRVADQSASDTGTLNSWSLTPNAGGSPPTTPPVSLAAYGSCEDTPASTGWGVYISGNVSNAPASVSGASVSYNAAGVSPEGGAASATVSLSTGTSSFSGNIPVQTGWEFLGGSGVNWTVTVTLTNGSSYSSSGYTSSCYH